MKRKINISNLFFSLVLVVTYFILYVVYNYSIEQNNINPSALVEVHFIDVGQGDAMLIKGENFNMLIDAGEHPVELLEYINNQGIRYFDYVIATHPHSDHIGAMADIIGNYEIGSFIMPDVIHTTVTFEKMIDALEKADCEVLKADEIYDFQIEDIEFKILNPHFDEYDDLNNYSVVVKMEVGNTSFLFMGDAEKVVERNLISSGQDLNSDVLKTGHHGSSTSSSKAFIEAVSPDAAVISCGADNSYGHPHKEVSEILNKNNVEVLRTDIMGTIIIYSDGSEIYYTQESQ